MNRFLFMSCRAHMGVSGSHARLLGAWRIGSIPRFANELGPLSKQPAASCTKELPSMATTIGWPLSTLARSCRFLAGLPRCRKAGSKSAWVHQRPMSDAPGTATVSAAAAPPCPPAERSVLFAIHKGRRFHRLMSFGSRAAEAPEVGKRRRVRRERDRARTRGIGMAAMQHPV